MQAWGGRGVKVTRGRWTWTDDFVNNELYDANAVAKGGIPAVALVAAPDSPPALAGAFCADIEGSAAVAGTEGDFSGDWTSVGEAGSWIDKKGLEEENWMPP